MGNADAVARWYHRENVIVCHILSHHKQQCFNKSKNTLTVSKSFQFLGVLTRHNAVAPTAWIAIISTVPLGGRHDVGCLLS